MIEITGFLDIQLLFLSVHFFSFLAMPRNLIGWHHRLNGHEFEQALGDGEGQGNLVCCSPCGCKESELTERLYNKDLTTGPPGNSPSVHFLINFIFFFSVALGSQQN